MPPGGGGRRVLLPPINFIFKLLQSHATVAVWLFEQTGLRIEGKIRGFDEFMNLVIDEAVEVKQPTKQDPAPENARRELGGDYLGLVNRRKRALKHAASYAQDKRSVAGMAGMAWQMDGGEIEWKASFEREKDHACHRQPTHYVGDWTGYVAVACATLLHLPARGGAA
ncbi:uncharacterized protein LTR77_010786 [Saxophila tyrrhenica]|uniref:Small nuclear ribonucleoprotein E n=1 Tax=Saxophila tyrrhenica TaxID=1690608 RepID=A0AAV9NXK6_9PEZI|nr:hypothetical protein LTR77_010786 [Saxophila tyrrhenica]